MVTPRTSRKKRVSFSLNADGSTDSPSETIPPAQSLPQGLTEDDVQRDDSPETVPTAVSSFAELSLDPRLQRAIDRLGWRTPTPVQAAVIPVAMAGRDVMVSAPTGSGKTAAFAIPLIQSICRSSPIASPAIRAVVLVPTRELVHQATTVLKGLCRFIDDLRVTSLAPSGTSGNRKQLKGQLGLGADVVVGTPASVAALCDADDSHSLRSVEYVVVDEADLLLSYGYEKDAREALSKIPTSAQSLLLSATLDTEGMDSFKKVILRRPLTVKISTEVKEGEGDDQESGATHYFSPLKNMKDRYLVTFAMLRLGVICGKVLIFVNQINSAFKLKLFLDQFKVKTAVLNSELPANSRIHCVEQFNAGVFDILIAADESSYNEKDDQNLKKAGAQKKRKRIAKDEEFGLARGVDFKGVAAVLNFDTPPSTASYTHRAGRTGRGGKSGTVLTLVSGEKEANRLMGIGRDTGQHIGPLAFRMEQVEAFRYRVEDCLRLVTDTAVTGARLADVRRELENAETLKDYFEDNPNDLEALQHNIRLAKNVQEHLGHIPSYLVPAELRESSAKVSVGRSRRSKAGKRRRVQANAKGKDPLKGFSVAGSSKQRFREKHGIRKKVSRPPAQVKTRRGKR